MKVIQADHDRRYQIPGVPGDARRPVDIDASNTGFRCLRSLRLYRFEAGSVVDGHAEEDEVFVVVTSGSLEMKIGWEDRPVDAVGVYMLAAPGDAKGAPFVAYLPPHSVYQLTPHTVVDVAYARATPVEGRSPAVFGVVASGTGDGITTLLDERSHAERLRLKVVRLEARAGKEVTLPLPGDADAGCEALVHVQSSPAEGVVSLLSDDGAWLPLHSWETAAFDPGERAVLRVAPEAAALVLTVLAA